MAGTIALLVGFSALILSAPRAPMTWETLLVPFSSGAPIVDDFRIHDMQRGAGNDVVLFIGRPAEATTIQIHILPRGAWPGVRETQSFSVGYETPHSPAPQRDTVTESVANVLRAHDRGLPSPGAIPLRPSDTSVLPWWLEMLRGERGRMIGVSFAIVGLLSITNAFTLTAAAFAWGVVSVATAIFGSPALPRDVGAAWTMPITALLMVVAARRRPGAADRATMLTIAIIALALRLGLGPWGPLHVNGQGPRFVAGAARDPAEIALYGPGYVEIFAPIAALAPVSPDWAVFAGNAAISAAIAPLGFVIARLAGIGSEAALLAALLLAVDPIALHMGATEAYFPILIALPLAAGSFFLFAAREVEQNRPGNAAVALIAAGFLLTQAARVHPSGWGLVACMPFLALAAQPARFSVRMRNAFAAATISLGLGIATSASAILDVLCNIRGGALMRPLPPPSLWPLAAIGAAGTAYFALAPQRWLSISASLCAAALLLTRHGYDQSWIWQQSYDRLYLALPVIAGAAVLSPLLRQRWIVAALVLGLLSTWWLYGWPVLNERTTDQLEYRWLREQVAQLPADCRLVHLVSAEKRVLGIPSYLPVTRPAVAVDIRQPATFESALVPAPCIYYVRTSLCSSPEGRPACDAIERRLSLSPLARATLPARPSSPLLSYDRDPVEIVIARATAPTLSPE